MTFKLSYRLVSFALAAVFGVLSAIPRNGLSALHLATGDHIHLSYSDDHGHEHGTRSTGDQQIVHMHADEAGELDSIVSDVLRHDCLKVVLPSNDYRSSMSLTGQEFFQSWEIVPPVPACVSNSLLLCIQRDPDVPPVAFGLTPPELVRSTIFLI
jgi:hypothetical protein